MALVPAILHPEWIEHATDIGATEIIATYEDKHKEKMIYFCPGEHFGDFFTLIKKMIPETEYIPAVLLTDEDYEEE